MKMGRPSFESAWEYADKLKGWYTKAEGRLLWGCAEECKWYLGFFLEVGSYRGRSTSLLASIPEAITHVIEPFILAPGSPNDTPESGGKYVQDIVQPEIVRDFLTNMAPWRGRIVIHPCKTEELTYVQSFSLIHIDGDHVDGLVEDCKLTRSLIPRGIAVFHDYEPIHTKFTKVKQYVDAFGWEVVGEADSSIAIRKPDKDLLAER